MREVPGAGLKLGVRCISMGQVSVAPILTFSPEGDGTAWLVAGWRCFL